MLSRVVLSGLACLAIAGCAAQEPMAPQLQMALQSPSTAADCRMVYREAAKNSGPGAPVAAPGGLAGAMVMAVATGVAAGIEESRNTKKLVACYDRVGAAPRERLPVRGPNAVSEEADMAAIMGTAPAPVMKIAPVSEARRRGPGGGAGFSTF